jgi:hypothetical protein
VIDLKEELQKSQFMAQKFQNLYESEKRNNSSPRHKTSVSKEDERDETSADSETASTQASQSSRTRRPFTPVTRPQTVAGFRFDDFQRRNEVILLFACHVIDTRLLMAS